MGCDIHMYTEVKKNGMWEIIQVPNTWKDFYKKCLDKAKKDNDKGDIKYYTRRIDKESDYVYEGIYDGRNYDLFGMLADVRNGRGFAGCDTRDGFRPIIEPKGLPIDVSDEIQYKSDEWGCDGYSHSYLTLQELLNYDWNMTTKKEVGLKKRDLKNF